MVTTTPISRKTCPLCLAILEITHIADGNPVTVKFERHTRESCEASTLQRIKVLEEMHFRDSRDLEAQSGVINELSLMIGPATAIVSAGRKWIGHRLKRAADLARLRNAFGTQDRENHNPLWQAEEEVATAIQSAIDAIEKRSAS